MYKLMKIVALLSVLSVLSCNTTESDTVSTWPTQYWPQSSPEAQGMDSGRLASMIEYINSENWGIDSLTIMRNGFNILETYKYPTNKDTLHIIHSCTKSVVSTLLGVAIEKGLLADTGVELYDIFPEFRPDAESDSEENLTLEHLLTMTTGLKSEDSYLYGWKGLNRVRRSDNWVEHILSLEREVLPGLRFDYSNLSSFLLSAVLQKICGEKTEEFADRNLFFPLGITDYLWPENPEGINIGWGELRLKLFDLAKIGYLVLNDGDWNGREIVSKEWLNRATDRHVKADTLQPHYGYQWWIASDDTVMALGYAGQYLIISKLHNLVVAINSTLSDEHFRIPEKVFREYIIPAIQSNEPLQENRRALNRLREAVSVWEALPEAVPRRKSSLENEITDIMFNLEENPYGMAAIQFRFYDNAAFVSEIYQDEVQDYKMGMDGSYAFTRVDEQDIGVVAHWVNNDTLKVTYFGLGGAWWTELS